MGHVTSMKLCPHAPGVGKKHRFDNRGPAAMKIAIVSHLKFPISRPFCGGLETFTFQYTQSLIDRGHDVTLFASGDSDPNLPLQPIIDRATIPESTRRLGRSDNGWIEAVEDEAYATLVERLGSGGYDVVHNHSLSPIPLRFASVLDTPIVTTLHAPPLPRMTTELVRRGADACGSFINISRSNASAWRTAIPKQTVIHNGVDTDFWKHCCEEKQQRAVWFGRILPDKGTHLAVRAAAAAGLPIDVIGPVCDQDYFHRRVLPSMGSRDRYLGHKTHEQLCELISRASVAMVTPCWDEPFGLVVAEALACGTPVAGFARGALPELIRPSVGCLAQPGSIDQLAAAARQCLSLSGMVARRYAQEHYSFDRMVRDYEIHYQRLLDSAVDRPTVAA